jgi:cell cycle checkpoint protein
MSAAPLLKVWEASSSQPFQPTVGKDAQFNVGFTLILFSFICASLFGLSMSIVLIDKPCSLSDS